MEQDRLRTLTLTTKVNEGELREILALTGGETMTSERLRTFLLERARRAPLEEVQVAEFLALRVIVVNLIDRLVSGMPMTEQTTRELVDYADQHKRAKARKLLAEPVTESR